MVAAVMVAAVGWRARAGSPRPSRTTAPAGALARLAEGEVARAVGAVELCRAALEVDAATEHWRRDMADAYRAELAATGEWQRQLEALRAPDGTDDGYVVARLDQARAALVVVLRDLERDRPGPSTLAACLAGPTPPATTPVACAKLDGRLLRGAAIDRELDYLDARAQTLMAALEQQPDARRRVELELALAEVVRAGDERSPICGNGPSEEQIEERLRVECEAARREVAAAAGR